MGAVGPVDVRLFGGVEVVGRSGSTAFGGPKQRALVARLAVEPGAVVSVDSLIDGIWGEEPPLTVRAALQVHVSQVRRAFEAVGVPGVLVTKAPGYCLDVPGDAVDVVRFRALAAQVRSSDPIAGLDAVRSALDLWRGEPLADVLWAPFASGVEVGLRSALADLLCDATEAALLSGRPTEVLTEVEVAAAAHPFHERLWMSAARLLYAVDRQADALERLGTLRRTLLDELGLDPSEAVRTLESQILQQDDSLVPNRVPAPAMSAFTRTNLPPVRALVGRDPLIAAVSRSVSETVTPRNVVTLIGPAGVGKTSVAVHVATKCAARHRDGACFVDLSGLDASAQVWLAVAAAVGLRPSTADDARGELFDALRTREMLIVLDNCEHVRGSVVDLIDGLEDRSPVTVLATSRSPLGAPDERVVRVDPLDDEDLAAVFVARARAADRAFDDDDEGVRQVVAHLGGLPLAAELVAPLVRSMTTRELAATLDGPSAGDADRWSMRDSILISVELLDPPARALFARLSVFPGGSPLDGIRQVCADPASGGARVLGAPLVDALTALVDASLLMADRTPEGTWYRLLHPIRAVASQILEDDESTELRVRHAEYVIAEVARQSVVVEGPDPRAALHGLERLAAGIRQAWVDAPAAGQHRLRLLGAFSPFAVLSNATLPELQAWFAEAVEHVEDPDVDERLLLRILLNAALLVSDRDQASEALLRRVIDLAGRLDDQFSLVVGTALSIDLAADHDNLAAAARAAELVAAAQRVGSGALIGFAIDYAVNPLFRVRDQSAARQLLEDARAVDTTTYGVHEGVVLAQTARLALADRDFDRADHFYGLAEQSANRTGAATALSYALFGRARVARSRGRDREALQLMERSLALTQIVQPNQTYQECVQLAMIGCDLGDERPVVQAASLLDRASRPVEQLAYQIVRGCLALLRDLHGAARTHLMNALEVCAATTYITQFTEVAEFWARTVEPRQRADTRRIIDSLAAGSIDIATALQRLRQLADDHDDDHA